MLENISDDQIDLLKWKTLDNKSLENGIISNLLTDLNIWYNKGTIKSNIKLITACDSQRHGSNVIYITTIIILNLGHGGIGYYLKEEEDYSYLLQPLQNRKERTEKTRSLMKQRLWNETLKSVKCGLWLNKQLKDYGLKVTEIHADINSNKKYRSSELLTSITSYIKGCGFIPRVKPDSWGSSSVANSKTK